MNNSKNIHSNNKLTRQNEIRRQTAIRVNAKNILFDRNGNKRDLIIMGNGMVQNIYNKINYNTISPLITTRASKRPQFGN